MRGRRTCGWMIRGFDMWKHERPAAGDRNALICAARGCDGCSVCNPYITQIKDEIVSNIFSPVLIIPVDRTVLIDVFDALIRLHDGGVTQVERAGNVINKCNLRERLESLKNMKFSGE